MLIFTRQMAWNDFSKMMITFLTVYWILIFMVSSFNLGGLNPVSDRTNFMLFVGTLSFNCGYSVFVIFKEKMDINITHKSLKFSEYYNDSIDVKINKTGYICIALLLTFQFEILNRYFAIIKASTIHDISGFTYGIGELFSSPIEVYFYSIVLECASQACAILGAYKLVNTTKNIKEYLNAIILLIPVALQSAIGATRHGYFQILVLIFFFYIVSITNKVNRPRKNKNDFNRHRARKVFIYIIIAVLALLIASYFTEMRNGRFGDSIDIGRGLSDLSSSVVYYMVGPLRAFDNEIEYLASVSRPGYGTATLAGLFELINLVINLFKIPSLPYQSYQNLFQHTFTNIGTNVSRFNAAYTYLATFYMDAGWIGIIVFSFLYGVFFSWVVNKFNKERNPFSLILLGTTVLTVFLSIFSWRFLYRSNVLMVIVFAYMSKRTYRKMKRQRLRKVKA